MLSIIISCWKDICGYTKVNQRTRFICSFRRGAMSSRVRDQRKLPDRLTSAADRWSITLELLPSDLQANSSPSPSRHTSQVIIANLWTSSTGGSPPPRREKGSFRERIIIPSREFIWLVSSSECGSRGRRRFGSADVCLRTSCLTIARYLRSCASHDYDPMSWSRRYDKSPTSAARRVCEIAKLIRQQCYIYIFIHT